MNGVNRTKTVMVLKTIGTTALVQLAVQTLTLGVAPMHKTMAAVEAAVAPTIPMVTEFRIQAMHAQTNMLMPKMTLMAMAALMIAAVAETVAELERRIPMAMV